MRTVVNLSDARKQAPGGGDGNAGGGGGGVAAQHATSAITDKEYQSELTHTDALGGGGHALGGGGGLSRSGGVRLEAIEIEGVGLHINTLASSTVLTQDSANPCTTPTQPEPSPNSERASEGGKERVARVARALSRTRGGACEQQGSVEMRKGGEAGKSERMGGGGGSRSGGGGKDEEGCPPPGLAGQEGGADGATAAGGVGRDTYWGGASGDVRLQMEEVTGAELKQGIGLTKPIQPEEALADARVRVRVSVTPAPPRPVRPPRR